MGQALRRATGKIKTSTPPPPPPRPPPEVIKNVERPPPPPETPVTSSVVQDHASVSNQEDLLKINEETGVLEERDPGFDAMLNKMVGRITTKPGGKLEMGEAFIVEKYNRPMPKLRSSTAEAVSDEQKPVPQGTLNAAQLKEIILLHQGKSEEHQGPMAVHDIAEKFRIDAVHVEKIIQFVSLPPENNTKSTE